MNITRWITGGCLALSLLCVSACKDEAGQAPEEAQADAKSAPLELDAPKEPALLADLEIVTTPATKVALSFKPAEIRAYQVSLRQLSSQQREGKTFGLDTIQEFELVKKIKENGDEGWTEAVSIRNVSVRPAKRKSKPDQVFKGPEEAIARMLQSLRFTVKTNSRGQVQEFKLLGPEAGRLKGMKEVLEQLVEQGAVELPEKPVAPGESWEGEEESFVEKRKTKNRVVSHHRTTFVGWAKGVKGCQRCAVLRTLTDHDINGKIAAPKMEGKTEGKGKSDSVILLDVDSGTMVQAAVSANSRQRFVLAGKRSDMVFLEEMETTVEQKLVQGK
jgi:hypothetical protein